VTSVSLRPLRKADVPELLRIHETPEVFRWWGSPPPDFPFEDPAAIRFVIEHDGALAGMVQYYEEPDPDYRHAMIDLFVDPALHGHGIGTQALREVIELLVKERGHHRLTIDPATANEAAIHVYGKVGFEPVGVLHRYERDHDGAGWHDCLLMEWLARDD
jgi:aminoglycoside 6'-N-acetyltransferase